MAVEDAWTSPLVVATLILGGTTLIVAIVAVFQDQIHGWLQRPKLKLAVTPSPPHSHKTSMDLYGLTSGGPTKVGTADCYYIRLLVSNEGAGRATDVQVFADRLEKRNASGSFELVTRFLPMALMWANLGSPSTAIQPGAKRHCDLAHIIDPAQRSAFPGEDIASVGVSQTVLSFDVEAKANNLGYLVMAGVYRLTVLLNAAEVPPRRHVIEINHTGQWHADETTMLSQGIGVTLVT